MATSRHLSRVIVLQTVFSHELHNGDPERAFNYIASDFDEKLNDYTFAKSLLNGVIKEIPNLREHIVKHAPQWPIDKIAPIDRVILEIGTYELLYSGDVPEVVAMDEAIELAKAFGNENSPKFINGVLNGIFNDTTIARAPRKPRDDRGSAIQ